MAESDQINGMLRMPNSRHLSSPSEVEEFCRALGGDSPIHSVLVANNGMAAVKFMRSIRTWALETFGTEKAILLVAMATPEDLKINAEHIRIADQFLEVPGGTNNNNYANVQLIVEIAERTRVSAVWPGWGHASENPELPDALKEKGIIFLGPPSAAMAALGDKIGSSLIAQAAGVPTLPWSGSHVKVPPETCHSIPEEIYKNACVSTTEEAVASCQVVGYPAMIKASWGGGGKGIRKVHNDDEVRALFKQVQGEVPGSPIFIMKVASQSRHLEVQLLCDKHGNVAALHSRDCSVQRRHQKIIEEGPITVAPPETVKELEQAARRLAKCVQYEGAATVEYLYSMETGEYYFLELNPRLQVEHPVTEWIAEINLPASQVAVGMGIPLYNIPEIRRFYGTEHGGGYHAWKEISAVATKFDLDKAQSVRPKGHCVAVRVTSEDPDDGFKPTSGRVEELNFKSKPNVWAYFSVKSGGAIHEFSDSQFGHVFAFGESRSLAIANMVLGLKEIQIRGEIRTNVDYTVDLLNAAEYRENKIHTGWLDSRIAMRVRAERPPWYLSVVGGALYEASSRSSSVVTDYVGYLSKGQIPPKHISLVNLTVTLNIEGSKYTIETVRGGPRSYKLRINESEIEAEIHSLRDGGLLMQLDGNSHVIYAETEAAGTRLLINGRTCLLQKEHDPSKLLADTPCKLLRFLVADGSHVDADMPYAEVEVMKMCMPLLLPASGVIHFVMPEGQAMQANDLIARLDLDDPSSVRRAEPFHGTFPKLGPPTAISGKVHQKFAASVNSAHMILAGYEHNINQVVQDLLNCLDSPELPFLQWQELMSVLATRLPKDLRNELDGKYKEYELNPDFRKSKDFPAKLLRGVIEANLAYCSEKDRVTNERLVEPLMSLVKSYEGGRESHARVVVKSLFEEYLSVEELFSDDIQSDVIERLRLQHAKDLEKVVYIVFSHQGVRNKNKLILRLMEALVYPNPSAYRDLLIRFSALNHTAYSGLALKASQLLEHTKLSELRTSIARSLSELEMFTEEGERVSTPRRKMAINERMEDLVCAPLAVEDALVALFDHSDPTLQRRVVETYIRRLYQHYLVRGSIRMQWHRSGLIALWEFSEEHIEQRKGQCATPLKQQVEDPIGKRWGVMVVVKSLQFLSTAIEAALKETSHFGAGVGNVSNGKALNYNRSNMLHIALVGINNQMSTLQDSGDEDQAQERINKLSKILKDNTVTSHLNGAGVRIVSCIIQRDEGRPPMRHSFQWSADKLYYDENPMLRHVEPPLSTFLELDKVNLEGYNDVKYTPSRDRQWHIYTLVKNKKDQRSNDQRMFLRTIVRQPSLTNGFLSGSTDNEVGRAQASLSFTSNSILRSLMAALEEIELHAHNEAVRSGHSHMYLCLLREQQLFDLIPFSRMTDGVGQEQATACALLKHMVLNIYEHVGVRMHRLSVCQWEVKLWLDCDGQANGAWRVVVTNVTGHTCTVDIYREVEDSNTHQLFYRSATPTAGPLHGVALHEPYKPLDAIDLKRYAARKNETTYCYDFPLAFETALKKSWKSGISHVAEANEHNQRYAKVTELIFADSTGSWGTPLVPVERPPGINDIGIVAWSMKLSTPEFPGGREIIVVAALSRARCLVCSAPITNLIREYNVRANASTDKAFSIGRFVTGLPPFSKKKSAENKWSLHKEGLQGRQLTDNMREKYNRKPWILEDETGQYQFQGHMEGSQSATATYYLLMLHGKEFHAFPAGSWYNFSKVAQYKQLTLEEAEEKMNKRKTSATGYERWMMKAATNGPAAFGSDIKKLEPTNDGEKESGRPKKGKDNEEGNNSDKGEENEEEEATRKDRLGLTKRGMDDDEEGGKDLDFDLDDEIEKGDDWEHEETFTDDDEAVDIDPEERADLAPEIPAPPEIKQDDEENEEEGGLSKSGKELKKLLGRASGQNESDADEDDEEDDQEDESSPVLAPKQQDQPKDEPVDNSPAKPTPSSGHARSTPPASKSKQKRKSGGDDAKASGGTASKKVKVEPDAKTSGVKDEAPSSSKPTSKASASSKSANVSPVTEDEIRTVLLAVAPVTTQDLVSRFKSRLRGPEDKNAFAEILKKISKIQKTNGHNYVVLREDKK